MNRRTEPRCFPHAVPSTQHYRNQVTRQLDADERYRIEHIDRGFPLDEAHNDERESAYGGRLRQPTPAQRLGLIR